MCVCACDCGGNNSASTNAIRQLMDHISLSSIKPFISISISRFVKSNDVRSFIDMESFTRMVLLFYPLFMKFNCFICVICTDQYIQYQFEIHTLAIKIFLLTFLLLLTVQSQCIHLNWNKVLAFVAPIPIKIYSVSVQLNRFNLKFKL